MTTTAKIVVDSVSPAGVRLTTMQLRYPKIIHGEFMTHRVFSRNASSSRAVPVERLIRDVVDDPYVPVHWGANQRGMQADQECNELVHIGDGMWFNMENCLISGDTTRGRAWLLARDNAVKIAGAFAVAGYHKQVVNRLLEPFCHVNVVVTATEWSNFFALRCHADAQPEMRALAEAMRDAMGASEPRPLTVGQWHLPYVWDDNPGETERYGTDVCVRLSVARCARVSYLTQEGKTPTLKEDLALYDRLVGSAPMHASPAEHQATPDRRIINLYGGSEDWGESYLHGNLRGWIQYRKTLNGESQ